MNDPRTIDEIKSLIYKGFCVSWGDLTVCDLRKYTYVFHSTKPFQVDSKSKKFSEVYCGIDEAVTVFMELRGKK